MLQMVSGEGVRSGGGRSVGGGGGMGRGRSGVYNFIMISTVVPA